MRLRAAIALLSGALLCSVPAGADPLAKDPAREALEALLGESGNAARAAIDQVVSEGDTRFAAVFIELMRAADVGVASPAAGTASARALEALTGLSHGRDWHAWVKWYAGTELAPPPGFTGWKGRLLGRVDEQFETLLRPDTKSDVRVEEIVWGGVPYEGIPSLDQPALIAAEAADYLGDDEPVFGIEIAGDARAYPLRILDWHEMANDTIGGRPVSLAYCTLCGAGIAYAGEASDGRSYDFGSSGLLMRSNKLMVDRQTRSLWNQFTGKPVVGKLVGSGLELERVPVVVARWRDWRETHPETKVLSLDTGFERPYHPGAAYGGYFASPETMFPVRVRSRLLPPKARIYGLDLGGVPKAYPLDALVEARVTHDRLNETDLVLLAPEPSITVDGRSVRPGATAAPYRAGAPVRVYQSGAHRFSLGDDDSLRDAQGRAWTITEQALVGPGGERLTRVVGVLGFWFGWHAYHPNSLVHGAETPPAS